MNYRIMRLGFFLSLFITLIYAASSLQISIAVAAQPQITGISGTLQHKGTITISGSGFGTKTQADPRKWDDFENGTLNEDIGNGWDKYSSDGVNPKYNNTQLRTNSTRSILLNFTTGMQYNCSFGLTYIIDKVYISGWRYVTTSGGPCRNFKTIRIWGNDPELFPDISHVSSAQESTNNLAGYDGVRNIDNEFAYQFTVGAWERIEYYFVQSDPGVANGQAYYWRNGALQKSNAAQKFRDESYGEYDWYKIRFGNFWATDTVVPTPHSYWWWDDVYIDDTLARVEISDSSTWADSTHREIQIPTAWSDNSITFSVNQGSFQNSDNVYLFVVDENGNASPGYPVTWGGTNLKPVVESQAAANITVNSAVLNGTVNPQYAETAYHFEYGTTTGYGLSTPVTSAGPGGTAVSVQETINGLNAQTTYHFRLVATNIAGTSNGGNVTFKTSESGGGGNSGGDSGGGGGGCFIAAIQGLYP